MATDLNLYMDAGGTFGQIWTISNPAASDPTIPGTPIDFTGCSAEMVIEAMYYVAPTYTLSTDAPTVNGGTLTLGDTAGTIGISVPPADTDLLANGAYSLRVTFTDGSVQTVATGSIFVDREVQ